MRDLIREDRGEFVFLAAVIAFTILAYMETLSFMQTSAVVPQIILYLIGGTLLLILVMKFHGEAIKERLGLTGTSAGFDIGDDDDEEDDQLAGLYDLDPVGVTKEMVWISLYVFGVMYIGFFTVSAVFCLAYILINETSPIRRRIPIAVVWTGFILGILYLLFLEFLQVSSVWRLGFLP